jgi:hypothetical protein
MANLACMAALLATIVTAAALGAEPDKPAAPDAKTVLAVRFKENPVIRPELSSTIGTNINGPSLIRVPEWVEKPLGRYYLYFAHHGGKFIRLAYADRLEGPWRIHEPGVLPLEETAATRHIASPDLHVDNDRREIRMYFHGMGASGNKQLTFLATSKDGLKFAAGREPLGPFYFRVFRHGGWWYAVAKEGVLLRSRDGATPFEEGPRLFQFSDPTLVVRHSAVKLDGNRLMIFYSRIGDEPESILLSTVDLAGDPGTGTARAVAGWMAWRASEPQVILKPEEKCEGADLPVEKSRSGAAAQPVRQLRDPGIFEESGRTYLLYSVAGERGIAIAELK